MQQHRAELLAATGAVDEIDDYVDLYRRIGEVAPLAIEPDWAALVLNFETAGTVEPDDPDSVQRVGPARPTRRRSRRSPSRTGC